MAMSDFRRNKLIYVFKAFFGLFTFLITRFQLMMLSSFVAKCFLPIDVDNSGAIDQQDFRLAAEVY
jgi:hypothetical protein